MLTDESHRSYAVKVLDYVQPFVFARSDDLTTGERIALQFWLLKVVKSLTSLADGFKATSGSNAVLQRLQMAAARFVE